MTNKDIALNVITYTSLIHGVRKLGERKEAARLFDEMVSKGILPNLHTFNVLIDTFYKEGLVGKAKNMVEMMTLGDIEPNTVTDNSLMDEVFDLMLSKGSMIDARSYNVLINGYCKHKRVDEAQMLVLEMCDMGVVPDTVAYDTLMDAFARWGE
ncbi:pentatricopeptide repeat-containing protein [Pyrus ussuriensis x Pyrus communis]|uniref:Pentatricopeptide repeat-containing protein n=1 Tax=Pyrus ussuriensis x Pyrus communis TaxID=2448454 RepID=A0A5N5GI98_9ROSA|nr:pentatricopeptide repeat-containing protein [Pyrus ussuriensis x Pyrus communis]